MALFILNGVIWRKYWGLKSGKFAQKNDANSGQEYYQIVKIMPSYKQIDKFGVQLLNVSNNFAGLKLFDKIRLKSDTIDL